MRVGSEPWDSTLVLRSSCGDSRPESESRLHHAHQGHFMMLGSFTARGLSFLTCKVEPVAVRLLRWSARQSRRPCSTSPEQLPDPLRPGLRAPASLTHHSCWQLQTASASNPVPGSRGDCLLSGGLSIFNEWFHLGPAGPGPGRSLTPTSHQQLPLPAQALAENHLMLSPC